MLTFFFGQSKIWGFTMNHIKNLHSLAPQTFIFLIWDTNHFLSPTFLFFIFYSFLLALIPLLIFLKSSVNGFFQLGLKGQKVCGRRQDFT